MWAHGLQIDKSYAVIDGVAQQIELVLAAEFVDEEVGQVAFLAFPQLWIVSYGQGGGIDIA